MTVTKYRRIPHEVEVLQWTGDNIDEVRDFLVGTAHIISPCHLPHAESPFYIRIYANTFGHSTARLYDYLVRHKDNEVELYTPRHFDRLYEEI